MDGTKYFRLNLDFGYAMRVNKQRFANPRQAIYTFLVRFEDTLSNDFPQLTREKPSIICRAKVAASEVVVLLFATLFLKEFVS